MESRVERYRVKLPQTAHGTFDQLIDVLSKL